MNKLLSLIGAVVFTLLQPLTADAQSWPQHENKYINDYADLINDKDEAKLRADLEALYADKGVEFTVLTLPDRAPFQTSGTYEDFSIGVFNEWKIGDAEKNNGILLLVLRDTHELSIELGTAYADDVDLVAGEIIDQVIVPAFRNDAYSQGIVDGADAVMRRIAKFEPPVVPAPIQVAEPAGETDEKGSSGSWLLGIIGALLAGGIGWGIFGRRIKDSVSRCPSCNARGIHTERKILEPATQESAGRGEEIVTCPKCGYTASTAFTIAMLAAHDTNAEDKKDDDSFGGGQSSGGGASGTW